MAGRFPGRTVEDLRPGEADRELRRPTALVHRDLRRARRWRARRRSSGPALCRLTEPAASSRGRLFFRPLALLGALPRRAPSGVGRVQARFEYAALRAELLALWNAERAGLEAGANEGQTEDRFIRPVLGLLRHSLAFRRDPRCGEDPDYFLYAGDAERDAAEQAGAAAKIERASRSATPSGSTSRSTGGPRRATPLRRSETTSSSRGRPFGILTNGRSGASTRGTRRSSSGPVTRSTSSRFWRRVDRTTPVLRRLLRCPRLSVPGPDGRSFLERALDDSALHAVEISDALERAVFAAVPPIAEGLLGERRAEREMLEMPSRTPSSSSTALSSVCIAEARDCSRLDADYRRYSIAQHRARSRAAPRPARPALRRRTTAYSPSFARSSG